MIIADAPDLSKDLTKKGKCSIWPPLSASKTNGFVVTSIISFKDEIRAEKDNEELSGRPLVAESVKLEDHIPSNSIVLLFFIILILSIINPVSELWDSNILTISFELINRLSLETLFSGKEIILVISFFIKLDDMFFVYFGSISIPDHVFNVLITLFLVSFWTPVFQSSPWTT